MWLIDNTALTFAQIADFCALHDLEVQAIADGDVGAGIQGYNPVLNKQLTDEEIKRCEEDPSARLVRSTSTLPPPTQRTGGLAMYRWHAVQISLTVSPGSSSITPISKTARLPG